MTISITKKYQTLVLLVGLPILLTILVAFQSAPKPQVKTKEYKQFAIEANAPQLTKHTRTKYNIHGEMIEYAEFGLNNNNKSVQKLLKLLKYNAQGLLVGIMVYDKNNALVWSEENKYNHRDQIVRISYTDYSQNAKKSYILLQYNEEGKLILKQKFDTKNNQIKEERKSYNSNGELASTQNWFYLSKDQKLVKKTISADYQYNQLGQITSSIHQEQEGKTRTKEIKLFENNALVSWSKLKNGKLISHFKHKKRDSISIQHQYLIPPPMVDPNNSVLEYDDDKRDPLQNISHKAYRTITLKSDKEGLPIKKVSREYNQVIEVIYYFYNEKKQLIKERVFDKLTRESKEIHYSYDAYQNVTENMIYQNDSLIQKKSYNYEYYHH